MLFIPALFLGIFLHDAWREAGPPEIGVGWLLAIVLGPKLAVIVVWALLTALNLRTMTKPTGRALLRLRERLAPVLRLAILASFGQDLAAGLLVRIRTGFDVALGLETVVLVDELLAMAPAMATLVAIWSLDYAIDRRAREAVLIRKLDDGEPPPAIWTRGEFLASQLRHQFGMLLPPLALILAWTELLAWWAPPPWVPPGLSVAIPVEGALSLVGVAVVFVMAPWIIRYVWDTIPLPSGPLRDRLIDLCREHGVGVRDLLLWRTHGGVINAGVMGLAPPVRFILMSDALLDRLTPTQVEAVMAHEIAHVRRGHMFWTLVLAITLLLALQLLINGLLLGWPSLASELGLPAGPPPTRGFDMIELIATVLLLIAWLAGFGWISRRFERQADAFAVQHLARRGVGGEAIEGGEAAPDDGPLDAATQSDDDRPAREPTPAAPTGRISAEAAEVMIGALHRVAVLNHVRLDRWEWRHGSIAGRQRRLRELVGRPLERQPIDRTVMRIQVAGLLVLGVVVAVMTLWPMLAQ